MDVEKFKKESKEIFDNEVKPQIANAKMTAVEWLIEQIKSDQYQKALSLSEWMKVFEQAKEMEKEQIIDARINGDRNKEL